MRKYVFNLTERHRLGSRWTIEAPSNAEALDPEAAFVMLLKGWAYMADNSAENWGHIGHDGYCGLTNQPTQLCLGLMDLNNEVDMKRTKMARHLRGKRRRQNKAMPKPGQRRRSRPSTPEERGGTPLRTR